MARQHNKTMQPLGTILKDFDSLKNKYISREWQDYGYRLAEDLDDLKHKALYIKFAKEQPRALLEAAKNFVKDANNVHSKGRLFMWKLKELKKEKKDREKEKSKRND